MKLRQTILPFLLILFLQNGLVAQFRTDLRRANKEYEIHAYNLAIKSYREAIDRRPDDLEALSRIADSYRHLNQMEEAEKYYVRAVAQRSVEPIRRLEYAHVLAALGKYDEARRWYTEYAKDNAGDGNHFAESALFAKTQQNATAVYTTTNEFANSSASDFGPTFYGANQIAFASSRVDIQRGSANWTGEAKNQLFLANIGKNNYLEAPYFLQNDSRYLFNIGPVAFSPDGRWVAYTQNNFTDGVRPLASGGMDLQMFVAEVTNTGDWINSKPFQYNGTNFSTGFPCFSPDGNVLYFSSNRPGSSGEYDIYSSNRTGTGNNWSEPVSLGSNVNSPGSEITPFHDGTNLYFASDWHQGLGGYDLFKVENNNGVWGRLAHLGNGINSARDDYGFVYDNVKNMGYVVSNRLGGRGNEDLYRVTKAGDNVVVTIKNASDGSVVANATVDFSACGQGSFQSNAQGAYTFQAVQGLNCELLITKEGYSSQRLPITVANLNGQTRNYEVVLTRINEEYQGRVLSARNSIALEGVIIEARNQATGTGVQTISDINGNYTLALSPNTSYLIRYTRTGYRDVNRTVRVDANFNSDVLGATPISDVNQPVQPDEGQGTGGIANNGNTNTVASGFSVQVAAANQPDLTKFTDATNFGNLYSKKEGKFYKVRVGVFATRAEADRALGLIKNQGYKGAFIVKEQGAPIANNDNLAPKGDNTNPTAPSTDSRYKIQLAAYRDLTNFNPAKIQNLGNIEEQQRSNGFIVKYLAGYATLAEARQTLKQTKTAGFKDAFIVENVDGTWKKVQ